MRPLSEFSRFLRGSAGSFAVPASFLTSYFYFVEQKTKRTHPSGERQCTKAFRDAHDDLLSSARGAVFARTGAPSTNASCLTRFSIHGSCSVCSTAPCRSEGSVLSAIIMKARTGSEVHFSLRGRPANHARFFSCKWSFRLWNPERVAEGI